MPTFIIERQYVLPVYQHLVVEAPDLASACRQAIEGDDWEGQVEDYDTSGPTTINLVKQLPDGYDEHRDISAVLYQDANVPLLDIPTEYLTPEPE
jgi:hypothetical protein